jgi:hypothetical protein
MKDVCVRLCITGNLCRSGGDGRDWEGVMKEYKETEERDAFLARELEDLDKAKKELLALIADLDVRIDYEFKSGILKINTEFQKYFSLMFGGGKAELTVVKEVKRRKKSDVEDLSDALSAGSTEYGAGSTEGDMSGESGTEEGPEGLEVNGGDVEKVRIHEDERLSKAMMINLYLQLMKEDIGMNIVKLIDMHSYRAVLVEDEKYGTCVLKVIRNRCRAKNGRVRPPIPSEVRIMKLLKKYKIRGVPEFYKWYYHDSFSTMLMPFYLAHQIESV